MPLFTIKPDQADLSDLAADLQHSSRAGRPGRDIRLAVWFRAQRSASAYGGAGADEIGVLIGCFGLTAAASI